MYSKGAVGGVLPLGCKNKRIGPACFLHPSGFEKIQPTVKSIG